MDIGVGAGCGRRGGATAWASLVLAMVMLALGVLALGGCTSEADLVQTLSKEKDAAVREAAATDLAQRHSLVATESLVTAAATNETAAAGLDALAEACGDAVDQAIRETATSGKKQLSEKLAVRLDETLACLGCISSDKAVEELIAVGTDTGDDAYLNTIRGTAAGELGNIGGPAVEPLMALAVEDKWARGALKCVGGEAVPALLAALGTQKWAEDVLAGIGEPAIQSLVGELAAEDSLAVHRALGALLRMYDAAEPEVAKVLLTTDMVPVLLADLSNQAFAEENKATKSDGFDHEITAQDVLIVIGEPAAALVLASTYEQKWLVLEIMGPDAVSALISGMNGQSRMNALYSAMTLVSIGETSPEAVKWFTTALEQKDLKAIAGNYLYYIGLGKAGSEQVISDALIKYGTKQMGLDCLNSGNDTLDAAGRKWASKHGYRVYTSSKNTEPAMKWGM